MAREQESVWKLCTAKDEVSAFNVHTSLRTNPSRYDENGVWTSTLMAADAYLEIREYDAELLIAGACRSVQAIETLAEDGTPMLPYRPARHLALQVHGEEYEVLEASVLDEFVPRRIEVKIGGHRPGR